ncbi:LysR family transcriptional regulator [Ruegeria sp. 2205SS24-7]|uniref:LysR family transcriptional regulator n=1 Tax=Ruegeria discodermiae TaxID=3064389 RepID=UPI0027423407|nr:LysR family transcriptional regulator [Ruegeria sp. 2205SS24-7]MDP5215957.1 LysR family transcriptional regulator [Ruegeria sp. 2205SS24-7]
MQAPLSRLDWAHIQTLLAVAETGSLSAAARRLGLTQPTVGRHISTLEDRLGLDLFTRTASGMQPTEAALDLLTPARRMQEAAHLLELHAAGAAQAESGSVRITASIFMAHHVLPPIFARLRRAVPEISLELVASDTTENLLFREADIAVRMVRPDQLDVVSRYVGKLEVGLFGHKDYLDRAGRPTRDADILTHEFVGYDRNDQIIQGFRDAGFAVDREFFTTRCDLQTAYWELIRAGCGLGFGQASVGRADPNLEEIPLSLPLPTLPIWLTTPEALRNSPLIRRVWSALDRELSEIVDQQQA